MTRPSHPPASWGIQEIEMLCSAGSSAGYTGGVGVESGGAGGGKSLSPPLPEGEGEQREVWGRE